MTLIKEKKTPSLSWTPVRIGKFYGSPACCGAKFCTWDEYQRAKKESAHMLKALGKGWQDNTHENLGWYAGVKKSVISISRDKDEGDYRAEILSGADQFIGYGETPRKAIGEALDQISEKLIALDRLYQDNRIERYS